MKTSRTIVYLIVGFIFPLLYNHGYSQYVFNGTQRGEYEIPGDPTHTHYDVTGNYTIDGNIFTFVNLAGTSSCPYGDTGVYTFTVNNNILNLVLVSDQCSGRGSFMPGDYTRQ